MLIEERGGAEAKVNAERGGEPLRRLGGKGHLVTHLALDGLVQVSIGDERCGNGGGALRGARAQAAAGRSAGGRQEVKLSRAIAGWASPETAAYFRGSSQGHFCAGAMLSELAQASRLWLNTVSSRKQETSDSVPWKQAPHTSEG